MFAKRFDFMSRKTDIHAVFDRIFAKRCSHLNFSIRPKIKMFLDAKWRNPTQN